MNFAEISKETIGFLFQSRKSLNKSPLPENIRVLVELRVSQINGCAYCCSLHAIEARNVGIETEKLDTLPAWELSTAFTTEEKLVLEWVEALTRLDQDYEDIREQLSEVYSEREIVDLTACVAIMCAINRITISLHD